MKYLKNRSLTINLGLSLGMTEEEVNNIIVCDKRYKYQTKEYLYDILFNKDNETIVLLSFDINNRDYMISEVDQGFKYTPTLAYINAGGDIYQMISGGNSLYTKDKSEAFNMLRETISYSC